MTELEKLKEISDCWSGMLDLLDEVISVMTELREKDRHLKEWDWQGPRCGLSRFRTQLWNYREEYRRKYLEALVEEESA